MVYQKSSKHILWLKSTYPKQEGNSQVDMLCRLDGSNAIIVVQVLPEDYCNQRALSYAVNVYCRQLKKMVGKI